VDVEQHFRSRRPFAGRPVMITFDDGYVDLGETAWPILRAHDFSAEVFVPTDMVGAEAAWDRLYGAPGQLMSWTDIVALRREGARFGSYFSATVLQMAGRACSSPTRPLALVVARSATRRANPFYRCAVWHRGRAVQARDCRMRLSGRLLLQTRFSVDWRRPAQFAAYRGVSRLDRGGIPQLPGNSNCVVGG